MIGDAAEGGAGASRAVAFLEVALPLPLLRTFIYRLDAAHAGAVLERGSRVVVGFGRRRLVGFAVGPVDRAPAGVRMREVERVLDDDPVLSETEWELARWMARYYVAPLGLVLKLFFPPGATYHVAAGTRAEAATPVERLHVLPAGDQGREKVGEIRDALSRAPAQRRAWEAARRLEDPVERSVFCEAVGVSDGVVRALAGRGFVTVEPRPVEMDPYGDAPLPAVTGEGPLTDEQETAVRAINEALAAGLPETFLLQGITGSGKTRVYVEAVAAALEGKGRAIVLVPEIGLAAPIVGRFRARFGDRVAVLHSGLSAGERRDAWRRIAEDRAPIVIGARSALFAPVGRAALVVVDEEHETAYKQDETPRYLARDVAVMRARLESAVTILGSATPSLESRFNAGEAKYRSLRLGRRIGDRPLPDVDVVDLRDDGILVAPGLSRPLAEALRDTLEAGDQAILLLNRRGFASFLQCLDCGHVPECPECRISLTYHRRRPRLLCHYCDHQEAPPDACPECGGRGLDRRGLGTQQVETAVRDLLPEARIGRMDFDTTGGKWAHAEIYRAMETRAMDVLVGTQMIAKGFDLPGVALVGVVSADTALHFPDFRAAERTFQLLVQVAGRAGRGSVPGRVLLQTYLPGHLAVVAATTHDYDTFYRTEVETRARLGYPPLRRVANVVVSGRDEGGVERATDRVAERLTTRASGGGLDVLGPAPCPLERLRGRSRHHLLLKADSPAALERALWDLASREEDLVGSAVRIEIDRDPLDLL